MIKTIFTILLLQLLLGSYSIAQIEKKPLSHDVYDGWKNIGRQQLSANGKWISWEVNPQQGDGWLYLKDIESDKTDSISRGSHPSFSPGSNYLAFYIKPPASQIRQAKAERRMEAEMPDDTLAIYVLSTNTKIYIDRVKSFAIAKTESDWMVWHLERDMLSSSEKSDLLSTGNRPGNTNTEGTMLVIFNPLTGEKHKFPNVIHYSLSNNGMLAAFIQAKDNQNHSAASDHPQVDDTTDHQYPIQENTTIKVFNTNTRTTITIFGSTGRALSITTCDKGNQAAFLFSQSKNNDNSSVNKLPRVYDLWYWKNGDTTALEIVTPTTAGMPEGWSVSENCELNFAAKGDKLFFGTAEIPQPNPEDTLLTEEKHRLDIWHYKEPLIQPQQLVELRNEQRRTYTAVYHIEDNKMVQLADRQVPDVTALQRGEGNLELGTSTLPYQIQNSFESGNYADVYLVDVHTGDRRLVLRKYRGSSHLSTLGDARISPGGKYLIWYSQADSNWYSLSLFENLMRNITTGIPRPLYNELHDQPGAPGPYGLATWTEDDRNVFIYDQYDIWKVDPSGREHPVSLTNSFGRSNHLIFRYINLDHEKEKVKPGDEIILSAFHRYNKKKRLL